MNNQKEKKLEAFLEKAIAKMELEQAPKDFLTSVMRQVEVEKVHTVSTIYKPLVSKKGWISIVLLVSIVFGFLGFSKHQAKMDWLTTFKLNTIGNMNLLDGVSHTFFVLDSTIYALAGLVVFMVVQVWYLKQFFAKRQVLL